MSKHNTTRSQVQTCYTETFGARFKPREPHRLSVRIPIRETWRLMARRRAEQVGRWQYDGGRSAAGGLFIVSAHWAPHTDGFGSSCHVVQSWSSSPRLSCSDASDSSDFTHFYSDNVEGERNHLSHPCLSEKTSPDAPISHFHHISHITAALPQRLKDFTRNILKRTCGILRWSRLSSSCAVLPAA